MTNSQRLLEYTKDLNLLFVEDYAELRESTTEILKNFFNIVDAVEDGKEALELYKKNSYDIVLTDIRMPNMDGVELTQEIYKLNQEQSIIILSAHDESKYLIPLINLGVAHFIKKPIDYQELINALLKVAKPFKEQEDDEAETNTHFILDKEYIYNRENKLLLKEDSRVYLTKYEIIFLDLLTSKKSKIFSNDDIVNYYFQYNENIDSQNIRKLVSKLRKKVPQNSIESIYGVGYRIIPQI